MHPPWLHIEAADIVLDILVTPGGSRERVMGTHAQRLKVQLVALPRENRANTALVRFLARTLRVARAQVAVVAGAASRSKTVRVAKLTPQRVLLALAPASVPPTRRRLPTGD
jgi:uncharacterized protein (TIGR00251 family)